MELQSIINFVLAATSAVFGWFAREMWSAVKELKSDLATLREQLPKEYISKNDYRDDMRDVKEMLSKIFDKLDGKQDK
jgi:predicted RNA-binding protein with EMAP domain